MLDTPLYELSCQSNGAHCAFPTEFSLIQHLRVKPKILNLGKTRQSWKSAPATWELLDNTKSLKKLANERGITQSAGLGFFFFNTSLMIYFAFPKLVSMNDEYQSCFRKREDKPIQVLR